MTTTIEESRTSAQATREEAAATIERLQAERAALSPEALSGASEAASRLAELEGEIAEAERRSELAEAALQELEKREQAEQVRAEEERMADLRESYNEVSKRRAKLERSAQTQLEKLLAALDEVKDVDHTQRALAVELDGVPSENLARHSSILDWWLSAHLREHMSSVSGHPDNRKPLAEHNPFPKAAPTPEELQEVREANRQQAAARREQEERIREQEARPEKIAHRRHELLGSRSDWMSGTPDQRQQAEEEVEQILAQEFPTREEN